MTLDDRANLVGHMIDQRVGPPRGPLVRHDGQWRNLIGLPGHHDPIGDHVDLKGRPQPRPNRGPDSYASTLGAGGKHRDRSADLESHPVADVEAGGLSYLPLDIGDRSSSEDVDVDGVPD
jgi:hypothetical protein